MLAADPLGSTSLAPRFLLGIAEGLARSPLWHGLTDPSEEGRSAVRVVRTECDEAWVLEVDDAVRADLAAHRWLHPARTG